MFLLQTAIHDLVPLASSLLAVVGGFTAWQSTRRSQGEVPELEEAEWREELQRRIVGPDEKSTMDADKNAELLTEALPEGMQEKTILAGSFVIEGELVAKEDTLIQGRVEGSIVAENHTVLIARQGQVNGEILAKRLIVEGKVSGRFSATEKVVLGKAADVKGEILSPRMAMEEGCKFNGKVRMGSPSISAASTRSGGKMASSR